METIIPFEPTRSPTIPLGSQWTYQVKWDGVRILAYYDGTAVKLFNRKKNERTPQYPELAQPSYCRASSFILDGEVIALGADGKPSFHEVMRRDGIRSVGKVPYAQSQVPVTYMIFDVIFLDGNWIHGVPLQERLDILSHRIVSNDHVQLISSHPDGNALYDAIRQQGMEGIVCKDRNSAYTIGGKDGSWVKVKNYGDVVAVVGGYTLNGGIVNAVLAGLFHEGKLYFIGKVGTGKLTSAHWRELTETLRKIRVARCPFAVQHPDMRGAHWVQPVVTAKIMYAEWRFREGRTMRQPSIQAFVDVPPTACVFE